MVDQKIKKQIEFYFSDANFRVDTFLRQQALLNNGYVPIETILTFKKMKQLGATIESVKEAVEDSKVVECKDDCLKKIETEEFKSYIAQSNYDARSLHISGFGKDSTLEDIENLLSVYMTPKLIRMRKTKNKEFSGSVFVELENEEEVEKACKLEIPTKLKDEEEAKRTKDEQTMLTIMKKTEYLEKKDELDEDKMTKEAKENLIKDFTDKLYKFEIIGKDVEIHEIKKLISDTAFVDKERLVVRLKFKREFSEKESKNEETTIKLTKMNEEEVKEYCENIRVKSKKPQKGGKKGGKKDKSKKDKTEKDKTEKDKTEKDKTEKESEKK
ncbi:Lupus La like protein B [Nosema granulosis]|uniref:Lupus La like protein B n=1 Tax=Nosema granulosis TaxID=83296 RepID=A0A9P6KYZ5_9MICR|nr:Lupus La like protein B [Nosema granulosis]